MEDKSRPRAGTCVAIVSERFDSSDDRISFERFHGIIETLTEDGYVVILGGNKQGQELVIPLMAELRPLPGGHFYFEESDEWVAPLFMYVIVDRATN